MGVAEIWGNGSGKVDSGFDEESGGRDSLIS